MHLTTECLHLFHSDCLETWYNIVARKGDLSCPECKFLTPCVSTFDLSLEPLLLNVLLGNTVNDPESTKNNDFVYSSDSSSKEYLKESVSNQIESGNI